MTARVLDGTAIAQTIRTEVAAQVAKLSAQGQKPGLAAVLVNLASANGCRAALEQIAQERGWDFFTWRK